MLFLLLSAISYKIKNWNMSAQQVNVFNKADISFLNGFRKHRASYRQTIAFNIIKVALFVIFIPIDCTLLTLGNRIIVAEAVALAISICSLIIAIYQYYTCFIKFGV